MKLLESLERIERIDQMVRRKATGSPKTLAQKLDVSERSVHRLIDLMKNMGAPIFYSLSRQSYCYEESVEFKFGFYLEGNQSEELFGGFDNSFDLFYRTANNWQ